MAERENLKFLGSLPVDTELVTLLDAAEGAEPPTAGSTEDAVLSEGFPLLQRYFKTSSWPLFKNIADQAVASLPTTEAVNLINSNG